MAKKIKQLDKDTKLYIEWYDASSDFNGWVEGDKDLDFIVVHSIGFLHNLTDKKITLKAHYTEGGEISQLTAIPIRWIKGWKILK